MSILTAARGQNFMGKPKFRPTLCKKFLPESLSIMTLILETHGPHDTTLCKRFSQDPIQHEHQLRARDVNVVNLQTESCRVDYNAIQENYK